MSLRQRVQDIGHARRVAAAAHFNRTRAEVDGRGGPVEEQHAHRLVVERARQAPFVAVPDGSLDRFLTHAYGGIVLAEPVMEHAFAEHELNLERGMLFQCYGLCEPWRGLILATELG